MKGSLHILFILICFVYTSKAGAMAMHCENCPKDTSAIKSVNTEVKESGIQSMTKDELITLVDLLFDFDTVPKKLINEIKLALAKYDSKEAKEIISFKLPEKNGVPAGEFYSEWEAKELFPESDMLKLSGDTSITLCLKGDGLGNYFHPFDGLVTSQFGWRDNRQHNGVDIDLNRGDKVAAAFDGMVRVAKYNGGFGNVVIVRHYNGLETVYAHLWKLKVKPGDIVTAGQIVGLGGNTGHSRGTHLHFEIRFKGVPINPKYIISFKTKQLRYEEIAIKKTKWGLVTHPESVKYYTVEKGDTILGLAKQFATTTTAIKEMNCLTGSVRLKEGQVINLVHY